jgi:hypothetical protein
MKFIGIVIFIFFLNVILSSCGTHGNIRVYVYSVPRKNLNSCINELFDKKVLIKGYMDTTNYVDPPDSDLLFHYGSFISGKDTLSFTYRIQNRIYLSNDEKDIVSKSSSWFAILYYAKNHDIMKKESDLSWSEIEYFLKQLETIVIPKLDSCAGTHEVRSN